MWPIRVFVIDLNMYICNIHFVLFFLAKCEADVKCWLLNWWNWLVQLKLKGVCWVNVLLYCRVEKERTCFQLCLGFKAWPEEEQDTSESEGETEGGPWLRLSGKRKQSEGVQVQRETGWECEALHMQMDHGACRSLRGTRSQLLYYTELRSAHTETTADWPLVEAEQNCSFM